MIGAKRERAGKRGAGVRLPPGLRQGLPDRVVQIRQLGAQSGRFLQMAQSFLQSSPPDEQLPQVVMHGIIRRVEAEGLPVGRDG
jgi:hypothetical protein